MKLPEVVQVNSWTSSGSGTVPEGSVIVGIEMFQVPCLKLQAPYLKTFKSANLSVAIKISQENVPCKYRLSCRASVPILFVRLVADAKNFCRHVEDFLKNSFTWRLRGHIVDVSYKRVSGESWHATYVCYAPSLQNKHTLCIILLYACQWTFDYSGQKCRAHECYLLTGCVSIIVPRYWLEQANVATSKVKLVFSRCSTYNELQHWSICIYILQGA